MPESTGQRVDDADDGIDLGELLVSLFEYKWLVILVTTLSVGLGAFYIFVAKPVYKADALVQIEKQASLVQGMAELTPFLNETVETAAEIEILNSRMVLGRVVEKLKLDIQAVPVYAPIIGAALARRSTNRDLAPPRFGLSDYAWGGEEIKVETLEVPAFDHGAPLDLVAGDQGHFRLVDAGNHFILNGKIGQYVESAGFSLFVSQLVARPNTHFKIWKVAYPGVINALRNSFNVKEVAKGSGVLQVSLTGGDIHHTAQVLDEILNAYVRQNVDRKSAEAENRLQFLTGQLPALKRQLEAAENALKEYRSKHGSIELTIETQNVLSSVVDIDKQMLTLQQEKEDLRPLFTADHPRVQAIEAKINQLRERRTSYNSDIAKLPQTQQTVLTLSHDVEIYSILYTDLLKTAQGLQIAKAGTVGSARIIDTALASDFPVAPRSMMILAASAIIGLVLSMALILLLRVLRLVVQDPEKIEEQIGLPVYATIPRSKEEVALSKGQNAGKGLGVLLAQAYPESDAVESLRSLRTTIHFALMDTAKKSLLITGPSPDIGKSFISKNLAALIAQTGKRVAIVDADLRKGHMHREFNLPRATGVSEYVSGTATLEAILKPTSVSGLSLVTTGDRPPNPSELLMHPRFADLLERLSSTHDLIIVDAPPVLAVADAATIARLAGATLLVVRDGRHPMRELEQTVKRLRQVGVAVKGFVFNDLDTTRQRYRYGYQGYVYRYSYAKS